MDYTAHGILQTKIWEWVAVPFSRGIFPTQGSNPSLLSLQDIGGHVTYHWGPLGIHIAPNDVISSFFMAE